MNTKEIGNFDSEQVKQAWLLLDATILLDLYTEENVIFGRIKNGEKVPFDSYLSDLGLQRLAPLLHCEEIEGRIFNKGIVSCGDIENLYYEIFCDKVTFLFDGAPTSIEDDDDLIYHYKYGLYEYLKELYPLFREIITLDVDPEFFAATPDIPDKDEQRVYYTKAAKFVTAIKLKHLRQGSCVDRYVKTMPFISPLIKRLLKKRKGRYILANSDTDSLDYKFALFSCFRYYNEDHAKLFELKTLRWKELHT